MKNIVLLLGFLLVVGASYGQVTCEDCLPNTVDLTASGPSGASYTWSTSETTPTITVSASGTYTVSVVVNGCSPVTETYNITLNPQPTPTCSATDAACGMMDGEATVSPAFSSYLWSNNETTQTITGLSAGTYTVTVTDANGCTNTCSATVGDTTGPSVSCAAVNSPVCFGATDGEVDATPTGGTAPYTYLWSNNATTQDITGLGAGTYTVTVTDANGCTATCMATIAEQAEVVVTGSCN